MDLFSAKEGSQRARYLLIAVPVVWLIAASLPEVLRDRVFPFDSALIAANGALFQRLFASFGEFLTAPMDWLWAYYDQYPALSVRRHPPLFGFVAGIVYSLFGVSASAAKFTVMLFACGFAVGVYCVARRMFANDVLAFCVALLTVTTPEFLLHFHTVWLDVPALAFGIWVFYFYLARLQGDSSLRPVLGMVFFAVLALYTYQPPVILLAGVFLHLLFREFRTLLADRQLWVGAGLLVVLMLPLAAFTLYFAADNLLATTGGLPESWKEFDSPTYGDWMIRDKLSLSYWTSYAEMIVLSSPVHVAGFALWLALWPVRRPSRAEIMFLICLAITYGCFSWLMVKGHRYTLYMMLPMSFLVVAAVRDAAARLTEKFRHASAAALAVLLSATLLQAAFVSLYAPYAFLSGMGEPVAEILGDRASPRILYSGRNDAAFVFYTRSLDVDGAATVARASVQVASPTDLARYIDETEIDVIVLEVDNPGYDTLEIIDEFRLAILNFCATRPDFEPRSDYNLPFGTDTTLGHVQLRVFERR